jgi:predicted NBD/HSP70 family sugar kinase
MTVNTVASLRQANLARALRALHADPSLTRAGLTAALGVSRNTAAQVVRQLVGAGLLEERPVGSAGVRGRPTTSLIFGCRSPVAVVAEISPSGLRVATVELGRLACDVIALPLAADPHDSVRRLGRAIAERCADLGERVFGVGVALYGIVDVDGSVLEAPNLGWRGVPLRAMLSSAVPEVTVTIHNDASCAALYEARYGAGRNADDVLYLYSARGVGGGITRNGVLAAGRHGVAGEVGHMLINPGGRKCRCGRSGCWETEVDRRALRRRYGPLPGRSDEQAVAHVLAADAAGDEAAASAVEETSRWFGEGLGSLLNVLDPERVVVAGLFVDLLRVRQRTVSSVTSERTLRRSHDIDDLIVVSEHGDDASLLGCAELVLEPLLTAAG